MVDAMRARLAAVAEYLPPMQQTSTRMSQLGVYVRLGRDAEAAALLEEVRRTLESPFDDYWHIGQLEIAIEARDTIALAEAAAGVKRVMDQFAFSFLAANIARGEATLLEVRGDWTGALAQWERVREIDPSQATVGRYIPRALRHLGRHDEAQNAIGEHLRSVPFAPTSNLEAARIRLTVRDTAGAREHLERAARMLEPADADHALAIEVRNLLAELDGA